jgi:cellulose synthase operon protein YhjQ
MTELNPQSDPNGTPEDVATLYSWANLHGAKYRDFSAARAQMREKARLRAEQAHEDVQRQAELEAEAAMAAEAERAAEDERAIEAAHQAELAAEEAAARHAELVASQAAEQARHAAEQLALQRAAEEAARLAARQAAEQAARQLAEQQRAAQEAERAARAAEQAARAAEEAERAARAEHAERAAQLAAHQAAERAAQVAAEQAEEAARRASQEAAERAAARVRELSEQRAAEQAAIRAAELAAQQASERAAQQRVWQTLRTDRTASSPFSTPVAPYSPPRPQGFDNAGYARTEAFRTAPRQQQYPPIREDNSMPPRTPWVTPDSQEPSGRPAWLNPERQETPGQPASQAAVPAAPEDTLQGSRDRLTSRWFALRGIFDGTPPPAEPIPAPVVSRTPAMAIFSLAGGVGKTSLVATLGRALSARGERVLLVDTAAFGLLPFFFGATDQRPGLLRTFSPPGASSDAPIQMLTIDPDSLGSETSSPESLSGEIGKYSRGVSRVIVDLATASGATTRRIMRMSPLVLVPMIPDMNSVVSVSSIDAFFEHNGNPGAMPALPFYLLNQFDASLPLHLDVREVLREQLGERLLPFALRRTPAMSEALAEGMTVMDYAPGSTLADDFSTLAGWVKSLSAPATTSYRGVRWSER